MAPTTQPIPQIYLDYILDHLEVDIYKGEVSNWKITWRKGRAVLWIRPEGTPGKTVLRAHIIWFVAKGFWPTLTIDHWNVVKSDDRIDNLRHVTNSTQMLNRYYSKNRTLPPGIVFNKQNKRYVAYIWRDHKADQLGSSKNLDEIIEVLNAAREDYGIEVIL